MYCDGDRNESDAEPYPGAPMTNLMEGQHKSHSPFKFRQICSQGDEEHAHVNFQVRLKNNDVNSMRGVLTEFSESSSIGNIVANNYGTRTMPMNNCNIDMNNCNNMNNCNIGNNRGSSEASSESEFDVINLLNEIDMVRENVGCRKELGLR